MFSFAKPSVYQTPTCFATYGVMGYPATNQLPTKVKPWSTILSQDYIHRVDLILPDELSLLIKEKILDGAAQIPSYHRIIMTLGQVLEGEFFTQYIKIGDVMMLSEGKVGVDNVFSLKDGKLTMYLDRETYERAGLVGKPHGVKGARGSQPRWIVEYDLRSPSALHGKKGFDRLVNACKNALNVPTTWLFCSLSKPPNPDPIAQYRQTKYTATPAVVQNMPIQIPPLNIPSAVLADRSRQELGEYSTEIYEWLSLVRLESPRVGLGDDINPYLSTYAVPGDPNGSNEGQLCKITWQGFIAPLWAVNTLAELIRTLPPEGWFSFSTTPFTRGVMGLGADYTIMRPPSSPGEYVLWEIKGHE
ncbi:ribonuclease P 40kDa subunit-domain-containing protein [Xylaria bambusicola]|uniref:ribonuclease P 40kDa subunit-domain-containing protein n=1 Tax=Xylaria bambusicola TaxID=326684 RepID=UPI0020077287|nr:ribonuclease P 40kDa subunit-domain-containing protein [Xylaria bambusicola]KAI0509302.1 ribonuclease P 40kDa subunit-domain-containing protein [Xylaria bambusicola]